MTYAFSTDFETTSQNLGISDERHDLFFEKAKEVSCRAVMFDNTITERPQAMEIYLNEIQPENIAEAFWAGNVFYSVFFQTEKFAEKMYRKVFSEE